MSQLNLGMIEPSIVNRVEDVTRPDCQTEEEWKDYTGFWLSSKEIVSTGHHLPKNLNMRDVLVDVCRDCNIPFQIAQTAIGRCNPVDMSVTPMMRGEDIDFDE